MSAVQWRVLFVLASSVAIGACSSGNGGSSGGAGSGGNGGVGVGGSAGKGSGGTGGGAAGKTGSGGAVGGSGGQGGSGAGAAGKNGAAGAGVAPTVVATLGRVPASLALDGANLYVTILETAAGGDGQVLKLPKTSVGATLDAGVGITTLASGLPNPRTIAVDGATVYWADREAAFPNYGAVFAVPTAGGSVTDVTGAATIYSRIAIANSVLYTLTANYGSISSFPLTGTAAGASQVIYTGTGTTLFGIDSDGTSVFFLVDVSPFAGGSGEVDLDQVPVGGGTATFLAKTTSGTVSSHLVHDASAIYWSEPGTIGPFDSEVHAVPKAGGAPVLLATLPLGAAQLVLDGNDIYAMTEFSLARFPKSGGTPVILASAPSGASADAYILTGSSIALATDDTYVYWLWESHGQILRLAK
jgi:hypothetical protein